MAKWFPHEMSSFLLPLEPIPGLYAAYKQPTHPQILRDVRNSIGNSLLYHT